MRNETAQSDREGRSGASTCSKAFIVKSLTAQHWFTGNAASRPRLSIPVLYTFIPSPTTPTLLANTEIHERILRYAATARHLSGA